MEKFTLINKAGKKLIDLTFFIKKNGN